MSGKARSRSVQSGARRVTTGLSAAIFGHSIRRRAMPASEDDDRPKKKIVHEIGQDLALLSIRELEERIALLNAEISRLAAAIASKQGSRSVADQFFKKEGRRAGGGAVPARRRRAGTALTVACGRHRNGAVELLHRLRPC